jgi:hypothetical protein
MNDKTKCMTFPQLETILIENLIDRQYDVSSVFIYDTKHKSLFKENKMIAVYGELPEQWKAFKNVYEI